MKTRNILTTLLVIAFAFLFGGNAQAQKYDKAGIKAAIVNVAGIPENLVSQKLVDQVYSYYQMAGEETFKKDFENEILPKLKAQYEEAMANGAISDQTQNVKAKVSAKAGTKFVVNNLTFKITYDSECTLERCDKATRGKVNVPDTVVNEGESYIVTAISEQAFDYCEYITSALLPSNVTTIGTYAFRNCQNLKNIVIPQKVTSIGDYAFERCSNLTAITLPNSLKRIGMQAFEDCYNLASITLPESLISIGSGAFHNCNSITQITIPSSLKRVPMDLFYGCKGLQTVILSEGVIGVNDKAFKDCVSLSSVSFPKTLQYIGSAAFMNTGLASLRIPGNVKNVFLGAFNKCTKLRNVVIEDGVVGVGETDPNSNVLLTAGSCFDGCTSLVSLSIPGSVKNVRSFSGLPWLTTVKLGEGIETIDVGSFNKCKSLTSITIPSTVKSIGYYAFAECNLKSVYLKVGSTCSFGEGAIKTVTLYVPADKKDEYEGISIKGLSYQILKTF